MALLKCKDCQKDVSSDVKKCPHCGAKVKKTGGIINTITDTLYTDFFAVVGLTIAFFVAFPIFKAFSPHEKPKTSAPEEPDRWEICSAVEVGIEKVLKAPTTAKFPDCREMKIIKEGPNLWLGASYVDAQNSFGAMIRQEYSAQVKKHGRDDWSLENYIFLNN